MSAQRANGSRNLKRSGCPLRTLAGEKEWSPAFSPRSSTTRLDRWVSRHERLSDVGAADRSRADDPRSSLLVHAQNLVIEALERALVLLDQLGLERAVAVARHLDSHVALVGTKRLFAGTVARVAATLALGGPLLVAQMVARALTFIDGVPCAIVPDQLKSAIVKACRYDPGVQRTTAELGRHYNTTILPARPMSPRDKAKVEVGVQIAERWLLARIRNETFTSLGDLNRRLFELTEIINTRPMRAYKASRRELFERLDKPALGPLPAEPFQASSWKEVRLNIDYHVDFDHHLYSAPHALLRQELWVRATASSLEIFHLGARVACHARSYVRGGRTTTPEHSWTGLRRQVRQHSPHRHCRSRSCRHRRRQRPQKHRQRPRKHRQRPVLPRQRL